MPNFRSPRALVTGGALAMVTLAAVLLPGIPGNAGADTNSGHLAARVDEILSAPDQAPPSDADQVLHQSARVEAFAEELRAFEAEQQRQADERAALEALAAAQAQAEAEQAALRELAVTAERSGQAGVPDDSYWDRMAVCETGGNWAMTGSRYSGGVGFYNGTWDAWGGREFAALAGHATREQQIIVANRVATQGYHGPRGYVKPVGYSGWGCVRKIGYP